MNGPWKMFQIREQLPSLTIPNHRMIPTHNSTFPFANMQEEKLIGYAHNPLEFCTAKSISRIPCKKF